MVFQTKAGLIIMVTNIVEGGRIKCHQYWPEQGAVLTFHNADGTSLDVELVDETVGLAWSRRILQLKQRNGSDVLSRHEARLNE